MTAFLALRPRDPVVIRDGRPFGATSGRRMKLLRWPPPSVLAGTVRTALGLARGLSFTDKSKAVEEAVTRLKAVEVGGPFPVVSGRMFLPAPADAAIRDGTPSAMRPELVGEGFGTDLPNGLRAVCPPDGKYQPVPAWWSADALAEWLADRRLATLTDQARFLDGPPAEERTHLEISPDTLAGKDGLLFSSAGLALDPFPAGSRDHGRLSARVRTADADLTTAAGALSGLRPFGGERRLVELEADRGPPSWACPESVADVLAVVKAGGGIRMVLATPALFERGWKPGWLKEENGRVGVPPGSSVNVRLVGVVNDRPQAVSGWDYQTNKPKPVRRLVPAGAVYFFELVGGDPAALTGRWLEAVSDEPADRTDGFGLAVWGVWSPEGGS